MLLSMLAGMNSKGSTHSFVDRLFYQRTGQIVVSAVLGLALALMFQRACKGRKCVIIQAPPLETLAGEVHREDGVCFKYVPKYVSCESARV
jgi:hypothetical protein